MIVDYLLVLGCGFYQLLDNLVIITVLAVNLDGGIGLGLFCLESCRVEEVYFFGVGA